MIELLSPSPHVLRARRQLTADDGLISQCRVMRWPLVPAKRVTIAAIFCIAGVLAAAAQADTISPPQGYTADDLVELYVELALLEEEGADNDQDGLLHKWPSDVAVRIIPQANTPDPDHVIEEAKRISDFLGSLGTSPAIVTFDKKGLEEFASEARLDGTGKPFEYTVVAFVAPRDELIARMQMIEASSPGILPPAFLTELPRVTEPICVGATTARTKNDPQIFRALLFVEYNEGFAACLFEELMQSFGISNDFPPGTPSIFNDDGTYDSPTALDLFLWRVHGDERLKAGMDVHSVVPVATEVILDLLGPR